MSNKDRILEISKSHKLTHIGSCLSVLPILEEIYATKGEHDKVILDNAHAHLAHLVVKESLNDAFDADELIKADIHCNRQAGCDALGGSLGHGLGVAIGYALANPKIKVHVVVSDGSMMEGSNWEALRLIDRLGISNIQIYANLNGFSAVAPVDFYTLKNRMQQFVRGIKYYQTKNGEGFEGVQGHYKIL